MSRESSMRLSGVNRRSQVGSWIGYAFAWLCAIVVTAVCLFIIGYLIKEGIHFLTWKFVSTDPNPSLSQNGGGGVRIPIAGTLLLIVLSMLVAIPLSVSSAVYLAEYMDESRFLTRTVRVGLEVLASVPSVVFGMFGLALFTLPMFTFLSSSGAEGAKAAFGRSFLTAGIIMGVHVLSFMTKVSEEAVRSVPKSYRHGALALGMTKWRSIRKIVLPAAGPGIATAVVLGMGLVAGDTAIVWLLLGGTMTMATDKWWQPANFVTVLRGTGSTLTTFTYVNSPAGEGNSPDLAIAAALVLILLVLALNLTAVAVARAQARAGKTS